MAFSDFIEKHIPEILIGTGISLSIGALITGIVNAPKVEAALQKKHEETGKEKLTVKETIKAVAKPMIAPVAMEVASAALIIAGASMRYKQSMGLAAACVAMEKSSELYQSKVKELVGEEKEAEIKKEVTKKKAEDSVPPMVNQVAPIVRNGTTLFQDSLSGQFFYSELEDVERTINTFNKYVLDSEGEEVPINDFYDMLGIENCGAGYCLGFGADENGRIRTLNARMDSKGNAETGFLYWVIDYDPMYLPHSNPW